jgi:hypothetical protein
MKKKVFLATHNEGKIERFKNLLRNTGLDVEIFTPKDFGLENIDPEENGKTLAENALIKAKAYFGKVDMSILANDTGFWVEGEGFVDAPKRKALGVADERSLTKQEIANMMLEFWKNIARKHGGKVDAAWMESFVVLNPDGTMRTAKSKREVILTDQVFGKAHIQMPVRALYISKTTNKPSIQHAAAEEILELKPVTDALLEVLGG